MITMKKPSRKMQRGMTMVELGMVLVVVAILGAVVFTAFANNMRRSSVNENRDAINATISCAQGNYGQKNLYPKLTSASVVTSNCVPNELRDRDASGNPLASATNKYGGAIQVAAATATGCTASTCRNLVWNNVPRAQCFDLAMAIESSAYALGIAAEADVKAPNALIDPDQVTAKCEAASTSNFIITAGR